MFKLGIFGPGQCGKETAALFVQNNTTLRYWGGTSKVITPYAAARLGVSEEEAYRTRRDHRELWADIGDELRKGDQAFLARKCLENGDILEGVRRREEMEVVIAAGLTSLNVWIDRPGCVDSTMGFGPELCDIVIQNFWGLDQFYRRLDRLVRSFGDIRPSPVRSAAVAPPPRYTTAWFDTGAGGSTAWADMDHRD